MPNKNLQKGDLAELEITEHDTIPKKFCIRGRMKGYRKWHILARIGEGENDERSHETIRQTAEAMAYSIQELYSLNAMLRAQK